MQLLKDITQSAELLRVEWPTLAPELRAQVIADGKVIKRIKYYNNQSGTGPLHQGSFQFSIVYFHVTPASLDKKRILTQIFTSEEIRVELTPEQVTQILGFGLQAFPDVTTQVITLYGDVPQITIGDEEDTEYR